MVRRPVVNYPFSSFKAALAKATGDASKAATFLAALDSMQKAIFSSSTQQGGTTITINGNDVQVTVRNVDLMLTGPVLIYTTTRSRFTVSEVSIWGDTVAGVGTAPEVGFGTSTSSDNVFTYSPLYGTSVGPSGNWMFTNGTGTRQQGLTLGGKLYLLKRPGTGKFSATVTMKGYYT